MSIPDTAESGINIGNVQNFCGLKVSVIVPGSILYLSVVERGRKRGFCEESVSTSLAVCSTEMNKD